MSAADVEEEFFPCSVCIYLMFTDHLDEEELCIWNQMESLCEHCLQHKTWTCCDVCTPLVHSVDPSNMGIGCGRCH